MHIATILHVSYNFLDGIGTPDVQQSYTYDLHDIIVVVATGKQQAKARKETVFTKSATPFTMCY
jgi:hypothetical protein